MAITVIFCLQAQGVSVSPVLPRAKLMIESVRKHIPNAKIVQLSNLDYPQIDGVDDIFRHKNAGDFIRWSLEVMVLFMQNCQDHILIVGTDMVLMQDISHIFDDDFDLAASPYPVRTRTDGTYCGEGLFFKYPHGIEVAADILEQYNNDPLIQDGWDGQQIALLRTIQNNRWKIKTLDFDIYNRTPDEPKTDLSGAVIVHYRGERKTFMLSDHGGKDLNLIEGFESNLNTAMATMIIQAEQNMARDLPLFVETPEHEGIAMIVGGAPSLQDELKNLRTHKQRGGVIFALNGTHDWLIERGIIPDFHVLLDARLDNIQFVSKPHKNVTYLIAAQCHPDIFDALKNHETIMWTACFDDPEQEKIFCRKFQKPICMIGGGATVGLKTMNLAYLLGFRNIRLYGMDSSYSGTENHAYRQELNDKESKIDIHAAGRDFICAPWMAKQAMEFQKQYRQLVGLGCQIKVLGEGLIPWIYQQLRGVA
jgi:uncharacterized Rossmann fold enzyme